MEQQANQHHHAKNATKDTNQILEHAIFAQETRGAMEQLHAKMDHQTVLNATTQ